MTFVVRVIIYNDMPPQRLSPSPALLSPMKHPPSIDPAAKIAPTAIVDEYHPSLGTRVPPTVIQAGASVGHHSIVYASADIHANASVGDRCTLHTHSTVRASAVLGEGCVVGEGAVVGEDARLEANCHVGPDCGVGTGASLGPGVVLWEPPG